MTLTGSINLTKIKKAIEEGQISVFKTESGQLLANIAVFVNDTPDQYGNDASIKAQPIKDKPDHKVYIGNLKKKANAVSEVGDEQGIVDDLPF